MSVTPGIDASNPRDLRVDFFLFFLTLAFTMFSDAADLFVFLSGYVFGLVYMKTLVADASPRRCAYADVIRCSFLAAL